MGLHFGELFKLRGVVMYRLSPFEQRALGGLFSNGFPNMIRRMQESFFKVVPPFVIGYVVYDQVEKRHAQLERKNPADYENDK